VIKLVHDVCREMTEYFREARLWVWKSWKHFGFNKHRLDCPGLQSWDYIGVYLDAYGTHEVDVTRCHASKPLNVL